MKASLGALRDARRMIAMQLDHEGKHEEARLCRAGMRDNAATRVFAEYQMLAAERHVHAERQGQMAGCLAGMAIGFLIAYILLV